MFPSSTSGFQDLHPAWTTGVNVMKMLLFGCTFVVDVYALQSTMWTATTCCGGVSVFSTQEFTGVFTLWTSHHRGGQDWLSVL